MTLGERFHTLCVSLCIVAGVALSHLVPSLFHSLGSVEIAKVNLPVTILVWLMIFPPVTEDRHYCLGEGEGPLARHWRGTGVTLLVILGMKPFSMALPGWFFVGYLFRCCLPAEQIKSCIAGIVLLAAAPCTASSASTRVRHWQQLSVC